MMQLQLVSAGTVAGILVLALVAWQYAFSLNVACTTSSSASFQPSFQTSNLQKRPILFVHFHKSGGSSVCRIMDRQTALNITDPLGNKRNDLRSNNCNVAFGGPRERYDWYYTIQTCRTLETYTMNNEGMSFQRNNFVAIEVPFHDALPCHGHWRPFAIMREPMSRVLSHIAFHNMKQSEVEDWISKKIVDPKRYLPFGYPNMNNLVIRQLLGRERFLDPTPIGEDDLIKAKTLVDDFDAFVPLEYLMHTKVLSILNETIPEYHDELLRYPVKANKNPNNNNNTEYPEAFLKLLQKENHYDTLLYNYVLQKIGLPALEK